MDDINHVDPDAVFYRLLFKDSDGNLTGKSWRAVAIGYDRRIPAQGRDTAVYSIELPSNGSYRADVRLTASMTFERSRFVGEMKTLFAPLSSQTEGLFFESRKSTMRSVMPM